MDNIIIKKNSYYDSVSLMTISEKGKALSKITDVVVSMGTKTNIELLQDIGFVDARFNEVGPNDLIIAVRAAEEESAQDASQKIEAMLTEKKTNSESAEEVKIISLQGAFKQTPDSNLVIISVPGAYAFIEAKKALLANKHVMLFSDNVTIQEENELKEYAVSKKLFMMGPDCGTAIINNTPIAFANVIPKLISI